jgi:hypothetical protein
MTKTGDALAMAKFAWKTSQIYLIGLCRDDFAGTLRA